MNILITSVGRRSYMVEYFKTALDGRGSVHAANSENTYALQLADHSLITPAIYDVSYVDFLMRYCVKNQISLIISLFDIDLPVLSKNKAKFYEIGVNVIVSDLEFIRTCNDKWKTYEFLLSNGFLTPKSYIGVEEAKSAITKGDINFPVIIKPRWGMGSIGVFEADNLKELEVFYAKVKAVVSRTYLKFESLEFLEESVIIQEKVSGAEHGLDLFHDLKGEFLCCVPKKKTAMRAGETDIAHVIHNPHLVELGRRLSQCTRHIANLDVDLFLNEEGSCSILEMNCRFGGQYPFSHLAGVNFPKAIIEMVSGKKLSPENLTFSDVIGAKDFVIQQL